MHQYLRAGLREKRADSGYILKMVKTYLCNIFYVWNKSKLRIKSNAQVLNIFSGFKILKFWGLQDQ